RQTLYQLIPFSVLECPNLKLKKLPWGRVPPAMVVCLWWRGSYFLITGGIYDVIVEPPGAGSVTDEHGRQGSFAFLA
uniref:Oligosaccharyltransferase complex subunit n=1 Tax=Moschus moschiferus TaxID=68415 RepID=A0A8C6DLL5_MOSMO